MIIDYGREIYQNMTFVYTDDEVLKLDVDINNIPNIFEGLPALQIKPISIGSTCRYSIKCTNMNGWRVGYRREQVVLMDPLGETRDIHLDNNLGYIVGFSSFEKSDIAVAHAVANKYFKTVDKIAKKITNGEI